MKGSCLIPGFHAVKEALTQGQEMIDGIWIAEGKRSARIQEILSIAMKNRIPVSFKPVFELDHWLPETAHQGIVALTGEFHYTDLNQLIDHALSGPDYALLIAADHITDEGNLGALMRTAAFFGTHGLILPKDRSAKVTEGVRKRSSGAYAHLPITIVVNLGRTLDILTEKGFWIIGAAGEADESIYQFDWKRDAVLVLGREDKGLTLPVRKRCHQMVRIPAAGRLNSLNIAVAGGVILSEIVRQKALV
jgi:23S rRNA (guanosine2251-2'-O)-methyltransferase